LAPGIIIAVIIVPILKVGQRLMNYANKTFSLNPAFPCSTILFSTAILLGSVLGSG
jgi:hypothetical protein